MPGGEPSDRLRLEYRVDDGVAIVDADGEIDVFTCGPLRDRLLALVDEGHSGLVVNLGRVSFIDSAGLGVLVAVWHRLRPFDGAPDRRRDGASHPRRAGPGRLRRGQMRHDRHQRPDAL